MPCWVGLGAWGTCARAFTDGSQLLHGDHSRDEEPSQEPCVEGSETGTCHINETVEKRGWDSRMQTTPCLLTLKKTSPKCKTASTPFDLRTHGTLTHITCISKCHWLRRLDLCYLSLTLLNCKNNWFISYQCPTDFQCCTMFHSQSASKTCKLLIQPIELPWHSSPCLYNPYSNDPQWSQNVGL